jgi:hypothetical protein
LESQGLIAADYFGADYFGADYFGAVYFLFSTAIFSIIAWVQAGSISIRKVREPFFYNSYLSERIVSG